ncbi:cytochrome P450 81Q32-like [Euphorbia lathyris]|uniref:cytochrome P450 81Q32-like n=1 Tax=Euphorbia lathyris TaxID=212925 RepID=UPI003313AB8C
MNMDQATWFYFLSTAIFLLIFQLQKLFLSKQRHKNVPPSPPAFPIIGHLHLLKEPVHRTLENLSIQYGPILTLLFGSRKVLIVSSPILVHECFTKNDIIFANRPRLLVGKHLNYNYTTLGACSYGNHWRNLRRLTTVETLSTNKLNSFVSIRADEVKVLLRGLYENSGRSFAKIEMQSRLSELSFNIIMRMISGKRYFGAEVENLEEAKRFRDFLKEFFLVGGTSDPGDFLPFLRWIDYQGAKKRVLRLEKISDELCQGLIDEHRRKRNLGQGTNTVIDNMLSLQESEPETYSDKIIKGQILIMVAAGTDTSAATLEWAMSLLLNHPEVLQKARKELDKVVGKDRLVDESDCSRLPYLHSIINETLRLYPVTPLLVPHESSADCTIGGYDIPAGTMLLVNAWALHRDPTVWDDPTSFKPERFEGLDTETYKFVPFGMGRRACPGAGLANRVVAWTLAALIQCFQWKRLSDEQVDMSEGTGLTMPKAQPLEALCKPHESLIHVLNEL